MIRQNRENPDFVLIDIRTPEGFMSGSIEGAINNNYHDRDFLRSLRSWIRTKPTFAISFAGKPKDCLW
jgi:rhodanese-related sulfurtransferase